MKKLAPAVAAGFLCMAVSMRASWSGIDDATPLPTVAPAPMSVDQQNATLKKYCGDCHNDGEMVGESPMPARPLITRRKPRR